MDKVKFGLCNVTIAKMKTAEDGTITYETPFAIPGAVNLTFTAEGENSPFYADNVKYFESYANNGYTGDLEIAKIPEQFETEILGQKKDANGAIIEGSDDTISPFAIGYQIDGDVSGTRFWYYNATVSRPSTEANTIEGSKTPNTDKLSITTSSRLSDKKVRAKLPLSETNKEVYDKFFEEVYEEAV